MSLRDLQTPTIKEEIRRFSSQYSARLNAHTNGLTANLMEPPDNRQLRRHLPNDLPTRFLVIVVFGILVVKVYFVSFIPKGHKRI
jgi:steroid 5-alpha reductase family enzyme